MKIDIRQVVITEPTSALEVLRRVRDLVLDEHKRLRMGTWYARREDSIYSDKSFFPSCGTVGCLAGWMGHVVNRPFYYEAILGSGWLISIAEIVADRGTPDCDLFRSYFTGGDAFYEDDGTKEQAEALAAFLDSWMSSHREELERRIILPGGQVQR
jgi:hypothetical protein